MGEWKTELESDVENYLVNPADLEAIQKFCNREVTAGQWSEVIPELLLWMKVSSMFVIWQHEKPCIIIDHAGFGLNNGMPREEC